MSEERQITIDRLREISVFSAVSTEELNRLATLPVKQFQVEEKLLAEGTTSTELALVLQGNFRLSTPGNEQIGGLTRAYSSAPNVVGEVGLITETPTPFNITCTSPVKALLASKEEFWKLMGECPQFRSAMLLSARTRLHLRQGMDLREQRMAALGTLTAGLMHEINNPGAAAGRAAKQLRENLNRMHELAKKFSEKEDHHTPEQHRCFWEMQERVLRRKKVDYMSSLEQSDAEELLVDWLETNGVGEPWLIAPTFAASGITSEELECLKTSMADDISLELVWMASLVGSMQMVDTVEESISRVSSLVGAVKIYTHEGQGQAHKIDVNASVYSTIVILKHRMREQNIRLSKEFGDDLPLVRAQRSSLNQVWTNLIDNAIDAAGNGGEVSVKTWHQEGEIFVSITDSGTGIPLDIQARIFDPFYTTKPAGKGTGLGLGIAYQIVREYGGELHFTSKPGETSFVIHLPLQPK